MDREYAEMLAAQAYDGPMRSVGKAFAANATTETEFAKICERITTAQKRLDDEINMVSNIADRLFGEQPASEGLGQVSPCRSGRVGGALDLLDGLHDRLGWLASAVSRLNNIA